jgi:hypothetical protein
MSTTKQKTRSKIEVPNAAKLELMKIGFRVRSLREERIGESYELFAIKNGINRISQYRIESGHNFQMINLLKICKGLNITLEEFFEGL